MLPEGAENASSFLLFLKTELTGRLSALLAEHCAKAAKTFKSAFKAKAGYAEVIGLQQSIGKLQSPSREIGVRSFTENASK